jgi:DNA-binding NtrC family response regulator
MLPHFQQVTGESPHGEAVFPIGENSRPREKSAPARVLVVDDEALIRWSIAETLRSASFQVLEAGDGHEALDVLRNDEPVDVILLDYRLPDSNDLTLLAAIRRIAPGAPVIMMTAFGTPEIVRGALELGAVSVISKPFEMGEIISIVTRARTA